MARRLRFTRNPEGMDYGQWIPTHAVKFNEDGTVSMMTEGPARTGNYGRRRNIAAGFWDAPPDEGGEFHPIRASYDYSRARAGESPLKKRKKAKAKKRRKR